jgi:Domain of unknown function (DUF4258)
MRECGEKAVEIISLARKKMAQRGIPESWFRETLTKPEQVVVGHGGRSVAHKRVVMEDKERLLRVVYEATENRFIVVTAYLTSDSRRYWKDRP